VGAVRARIPCIRPTAKPADPEGRLTVVRGSILAIDHPGDPFSLALVRADGAREGALKRATRVSSSNGLSGRLAGGLGGRRRGCRGRTLEGSLYLLALLYAGLAERELDWIHRLTAGSIRFPAVLTQR
jgi:hypothetical protein